MKSHSKVSKVAYFLQSIIPLIFVCWVAVLHCQTSIPMDIIMGGNVIQEETCENEYGYFNLAISFTEGIIMYNDEHGDYEENIVCWEDQGSWLTVWTDKAQYECAWMPLITARMYTYIIKTPYNGVIQAMWQEKHTAPSPPSH